MAVTLGEAQSELLMASALFLSPVIGRNPLKQAPDLSRQNLDASDDFAVGQKSEDHGQCQPGPSPLIIDKLKKQDQDRQKEKQPQEAQNQTEMQRPSHSQNSEFNWSLPLLFSENHWAIVMNELLSAAPRGSVLLLIIFSVHCPQPKYSLNDFPFSYS